MEPSKAERLKEWGPELRVVTDNAGSHYVGRRDHSCAFLTEDRLCEIHGRAGAFAKPLTCQIFPFVLTPTPDGVTVGLSYFCPSVRARHGRPIVSHQTELERWLSDLKLPSDRQAPITVFQEVTTSWIGYKILEAELQSRLKSQYPLEVIRGLRWHLNQTYTTFGILPIEELFQAHPKPCGQLEQDQAQKLLDFAGVTRVESIEKPDIDLIHRYLLSLVHRKFLLKSSSLLEGVSLLSLVALSLSLYEGPTDAAIEPLELCLTHGKDIPPFGNKLVTMEL